MATGGTVLRRAYVPVLPELDGFDRELLEKLRAQDPGSKAGKQIGGQLNRALKRLHLDPIDVQADPKQALAKIEETEARLKRLAAQSPTVDVKVKIEQGLAQLARFKKQVGQVGEEAADEFTSDFARDLGKLGIALDRLNLPSIDINADPRQAFKAIEETEARLAKLSAESATVEIRVDVEKTRGDLARLKKQLGDFGGGDAGSSLGKSLALLKSPQALAAVAIAAAPVIGAAVSAGVIGGAGAGGVIGGLLLVKDDPRVSAAGQALGKKLLDTLKADAAPFVEPAIAGIAKVENRFDEANKRIQNIFSKSSGFLGPLVDGATQGVDEILRGVESLVTKGRPVIDALSSSFATIGHAVGDAMSTISGGSDEAASALHVLSESIAVMIQATGYLVRGLTEVYGVISYLPGKFQEFERYVGRQVGIQMDAGESAKGAAVEISKMVAAQLANADAAVAAARANNLYVATADDVKNQQQLVTDTQKAVNESLAAMAPAGTRAAQIATAMTKAIQALYGAQMQAIDANEAYEASWDALSESIKANGKSLNIHSAAGRSNRDALEAVATATRDAYVADINSGVAIGQATKKHDQRIAALKEEAKRNGLDRAETKKLVDTYGSIPKGKQTKLVVAGVDAVIQALKDLYVFQRSLADGIPVASEIAKLKGEKGPAKRYGGYASGGFFDGMLPGPASSVDNLTGIGRDGRAFGLAGGEFIVNARQTKKYRTELEDLNAGRNGFASGGYYPVEQRPFRVTTTASRTRIPSRSEVEAKVILQVPSGGRTSDWIVRAARQIVPGIEVLSKDRPGAVTLTGNPSYHAFGRAVDFHWNRKLAEVWNQRYFARTKELITPWQDLNIQNGHRHAYSPIVFNQHSFAGGNPHDHIAMDDGGFRLLQPGLNVIRNGTGRPEPIGGPAAMASIGNTYQITVQVAPGAHPAETGRQIVLAIQSFEQSNGNRWRKDGS